MNKPTMPDFVKWARKLYDREDAAIALEQAFNQGYQLGYNESRSIPLGDVDNLFTEDETSVYGDEK